MSVTAKLVRVFLVDKQLRGLTARLRSAEQFLGDQVKQLGQIDTTRADLESKLKQSQASAMGFESEAKGLEAKLNSLSEKMNASTNHKEYKAFLVEVNTYKTQKSELETKALEAMGKVEDLKKQLSELDTKRQEREKVKGVAATEQETRASEIRDRVTQLQGQRDALAKDVPADTMRTYDRLLKQRGDDAMAHVEEQSRRHMEYHCGACMMGIPMEAVSGLLSSGKLTLCASCGCILYIEEELANSMTQTASKR